MAKAQPGGNTKRDATKRPLFQKHESGFKARFAGWMRVADRWEVISLACAPLAFAFVLFQDDLGVPASLSGFAFVALVYYVGYFFLVLLIWDRRVDSEKVRIGRGLRRQKLRDITLREEQRKTTDGARAEAQARSEAAIRRGRVKAGLPPDPEG